jgi:hypothetical protein
MQTVFLMQAPLVRPSGFLGPDLDRRPLVGSLSHPRLPLRVNDVNSSPHAPDPNQAGTVRDGLQLAVIA